MDNNASKNIKSKILLILSIVIVTDLVAAVVIFLLFRSMSFYVRIFMVLLVIMLSIFSALFIAVLVNKNKINELENNTYEQLLESIKNCKNKNSNYS